MQRSRIILIALLALALVAGGVVAGLRFFSGDGAPPSDDGMTAGGRFRIAVATQETIERVITAQIRLAQERESRAAPSPGVGAAKGAAPISAEESAKAAERAIVVPIYGQAAAAGRAPDGAPQSDGGAEPGAGGASEGVEESLLEADSQKFRQLLGAQLEGRIVGELAKSSRFAPVEAGQVVAAINELRGADDAKPEPAAQGARGKTVVERLLERVTKNQSGGGEAERSSSMDIVRTFVDEGYLARAGSQVGAQYFLFVDVEEPLFSIRHVISRASGKHAYVFSAQPSILYRLFDVRTGEVAAAGVIRFEQPIVETAQENSDAVYRRAEAEAGPSGEFERVGWAIPKIQTLTYRVNERVAKDVVQAVLEAVAPPSIVAAGQRLSINRGANDGVSAGTEFEVYRLGAAIAEDGGRREIGRERAYVGVVRVSDVQPTVAEVEVVSGERPQLGDVLSRPKQSQEQASAAGTARPDCRGVLGEAALKECQRVAGGGAAANVTPVAIEFVSVRFLAPYTGPPLQPGRSIEETIEAQVSRALGDSLSGDRRIQVLPRADLQRILRERERAAEAEGRFGEQVEIGLATAGYVITGEAVVGIRETSETVSFEGRSRTVPGSARTIVTIDGRFRAQTDKGVQIGAVETETKRTLTALSAAGLTDALDELSRKAAAELLKQMFPIKVARVDGERVRLIGGENAGLKVGSRLRAYSVGDAIVDDVTGAVMEGSRDLVGELEVIDVKGQTATAKFRAKPFGLKPGDVVEPAGTVAAVGGAAGKPKPAPAPDPAKPLVKF